MFFYNSLINILNGNKVKSKDVSAKSLKGNGIKIMPGTFIDGNSSLESYTYIGYNCFITKSHIGRYVSVGNNVSIGPGEHALTNISTSSLFYDNAYDRLTEKDCIIGNDVWIGVDSIIKRGVKIGNGAVIGANSVVTHDVPDFAVVIGSPARIVKYRFSEDQINLMNESQWWNLEIREAKDLIENIKDRIPTI